MLDRRHSNIRHGVTVAQAGPALAHVVQAVIHHA